MTPLHRPSPVDERARAISGAAPPAELAERLLQGETLVVSDRYSTGRAVLRALDRVLPAPAPTAPYPERQAHRATRRRAARRLLVQVRKHRFALPESPPCGFLAELYPEQPSFTLPFPDAEDLARSWKTYDEGVKLAVLGYPLHPFYGTYIPARTEHLELFTTWLSSYDGPRGRAVDVGTGSGVLALLLARAGFEAVLATDLNPNAIESVRRELQRHPGPVEPHLGDLLADVEGSFDLIVFNPPWIQGDPQDPIDEALFFRPGLFERFFDQAVQRLRRGGQVALVFSNILSLVQKDLAHPIEAELERGRFTLVQRLQRKIRPKRDATGQRRRTRERVEIWILALAPPMRAE